MKVAVVILNWNGKELLEKFIPSLLEFSKEAELHVIDNASSDNSIPYLKENFPSIHLISLPENYGFAKGYNEGLKNIEADLFCLLNNDIRVTKGWLPPIIQAFKTSSLAIAQPHMIDLKEPTHFEYAGAAGGYIDQYGYSFCRGRVFDVCEQNNQQYDATVDCFWASGACFFIRAEVWKTLGGFDEDFFMHQEEVDLCWRAFNHGYTCQSIGASKVYHQGAASLQPSARKTYFNHRNAIMMMIKNLPKEPLFSILFVRLLLDGIAGIRYLLSGHPSSFFMVIKAHIYNYARLKKNLAKRGESMKKTRYFTLKSVVWTYFVLRKSKFSDFK
jgi:GT2 family glycosyltransferase